MKDERCTIFSLQDIVPGDGLPAFTRTVKNWFGFQSSHNLP